MWIFMEDLYTPEEHFRPWKQAGPQEEMNLPTIDFWGDIRASLNSGTPKTPQNDHFL